MGNQQHQQLCLLTMACLLVSVQVSGAAPVSESQWTVSSSTAATPTGSSSADSGSSSSAIESDFKQWVINGTDVNRNYIDTLSPEEVDKYHTSGQLPDRTRQLICHFIKQHGDALGQTPPPDCGEAAASFDPVLKEVLERGIQPVETIHKPDQS